MNQKNLALIMLPLILLMGGCHDEDPRKGSVAVTWTTLTADTEGAGVAAACPEGATSAVVFALADGQTQPYEDVAACAAGALEIKDLPAGNYAIWVRLTDSTFLTRYAESGTQFVTVTADSTSTPPNYPIFVDHGFFVLSWNLRPPGSPGPVACSAIPGTNRIAITVTGEGAALFDTVVDCEDGLAPAVAITRPLPSGLGSGPAYSVVVQLINEENQVVGSSATITPAEAGEIDYGNKYQDLGTVEIDQDWPEDI